MNIITYIYNAEDGEVHVTITADPPDADGTKEVQESILGDFNDDVDVRMACLETAKSHELWPAYFYDTPKVTGSRGGKKSSANMTAEQRHKRAQKAVQAREAKKKKTS